LVAAAAIASLALSTVGRADDIFLVNGAGNLGEFTTSGATVNASLVTGQGNGLQGIAASGDNVFITNITAGTIGEYNTADSTFNPSFITSLVAPYGIAVSGDDLYVATNSGGLTTIGEYTTAGATVNASLITIPESYSFQPESMVVSGGNLYVVLNSDSGTIGEYDATTGATINANLITGLYFPHSVTVLDGELFVGGGAGYLGGWVAEYSLSGAPINTSLVTGQGPISGIAASGGNLFVATGTLDGNAVVEYDTSGAIVNGAVVSTPDFPGPLALAIVAPEPSTLMMLAIGGAGLLAYGTRRRGSRAT
jgi:WD40 repeat protein